MAEWQAFCAGALDLVLDETGLTVRFNNGRQHRVDVRAGTDAIELRGVVARRGIVGGIDDAALLAWERNRAGSLVGFRIDERGRLLGESWVPLAGLTKEEFQLYVRSTAAQCDLFEFQLTGKDRE